MHFLCSLDGDLQLTCCCSQGKKKRSFVAP